MSHTFDIVETHPVTLAVTEAFLKQPEIPLRIAEMYDIVYAWLPESGMERVGQNYAVYDRFSPEGMRMRVGFPVSQSFADDAKVQCMELPGGRAAHVTHVGPYNKIYETTQRLYDWCVEESLDLAGISWEVYGDWEEDESKLVTDIYFLLR